VVAISNISVSDLCDSELLTTHQNTMERLDMHPHVLRKRSDAHALEKLRHNYVCRSGLKLREICATDVHIARLLTKARSIGVFTFVDICSAPGSFAQCIIGLVDRYCDIRASSISYSGVSHIRMKYEHRDVRTHKGPRNNDVCQEIVRQVFELRHRDVSKDTQLAVCDGGWPNTCPYTQEKDHWNLLMSEMKMCSSILGVGGCAIIKVFTSINPETVRLMYCMSRCFETVYTTKPSVCRPTNCERYLVCVNRNEQAFELLEHIPISFIRDIRIGNNRQLEQHMSAIELLLNMSNTRENYSRDRVICDKYERFIRCTIRKSTEHHPFHR
jgi:23S rRNA U2552 (ribose-2'-O)-methylase RlmE/FtsJ